MRQAEREAAENDYKEMKDAAAELVLLSKQLSEEIDKGSEHVISVKLVEQIGKIEKVVKELRNKATDY
jgi:hypothetical protein